MSSTSTKPRGGASSGPTAKPASAPAPAEKPKLADLPDRHKPFDELEGSALTLNEQQKLSRMLILKWFETHKRSKLKGLQDQLIDASSEQKEKMRETIIKNTEKELEKHKYLSEEERKARARQFADEILGVTDGVANIEDIAKRHERKGKDEESFYTILDAEVKKGKDVETLQKLSKDPQFAHVIAVIKGADPFAGKRIETAMNEGNYEEMRQQVVDASKRAGGPITLSKDKVDGFVGAIIFGNPETKKITGIGTIDGIINAINKLRDIGHYFAINKASEKLKINYLRAARMSKKTFSALKQESDLLQSNRHLIESKANQTSNDKLRLVYIDEVNRVIGQIETDARKNNIEQCFDRAMDKYLAKQDKLTPEDKIMIKQQSSWKSLRVRDLFEFMYAKGEDRDNTLLLSLMHAPRMWRYAKKFLINRDATVVTQTMRRYHARRIANWASDMAAKGGKQWKLDGVFGAMDKLERKARIGGGNIDDMYGKTEAFNKEYNKNAGARDARAPMDKEMYDHDKILKEYQDLVQKATREMTKQARDLIGVGKYVDDIARSKGNAFLSTPIHELPHLSDQSLQQLFPGKTAAELKLMNLKGSDLIHAYQKRMVDLRTMQDVARTKFAVLAENIDMKVSGGEAFGKRWQETVEVARGKSERKMIQDQLGDIKSHVVAGSKPKYYAKTYGLPAIILGLQGYNLATGKSKTNEVLWDVGEAAIGFVPFAGTALDIRNLVTGTSLSGKKLSWRERAMTGVFAAVGVVADAATVLGGAGLALRGAMGGVRGARRTMHAASTAHDLKGLAYAEKLPWIQRQVARGAGVFDKAKRADKAAEAAFASKAMEQARLMAKHDIRDLEKIEEAIDIAKKSGDLNKAKDLEKLRDMYKGAGAIDYMKVWKEYKGAEMAIEVPVNVTGKMWMATRQAFQDVKAFFMKIGVPADTLKSYERTFDKVEAAKRSRVQAIEELAEINKKREVIIESQTKYKAAFGKFSTLGKNEAKYADTVDKVRALEQNGMKQLAEVSSLERKLENAEQALKAGKATQKEVDAAKDLLSKAKAKHGDVTSELKKLSSEKDQLGKQVGSKNQALKKELDEADNNLSGLEKGVVEKELAVRNANDAIHSANGARASLEFEMMTKAQDFARISDHMRGAAKVLQWGGLAMGATWFLSGFRSDPAAQYQAIHKIAAPVVGGVAGAAKYVYLEDHSGVPAIDQLVAKRVASVSARNVLKQKMEKARTEGGDPAGVLATHWNSEEAQELAKKEGVYERVQGLIAQGKVKVQEAKDNLKGAVAGAKSKASTIDIASGDSGRTARE